MTADSAAAGFALDPYVLNHPQTRPFWHAAAEGWLLLPRCQACGRAHWYPRPFCPLCQSVDIEWMTASGMGTIYSFSVMRRVKPQYVVALVTLDEGPTLMTNLVDCEPETLAIGQRVTAKFAASPEGRHVPVFTPAPERG